MRKWKGVRAWINRDDGRLYQAGNYDLDVLELIAYVCLMVSGINWLLHDKAGIESTVIGWIAFISGVFFLSLNTFKQKR
jgi:hypothetical protein